MQIKLTTTTTATGSSHRASQAATKGFEFDKLESLDRFKATSSTTPGTGSDKKNAIKLNMDANERLNGEVQRGCGGGRPVLFHEANAVFKIPVSNKWSVFGTSQIQLKTNHTTRIVIGLLALFIVTSFVLNGRVQMLVDRNGALEEQIGMLEERMKFVMEEMTRLSQQKTDENVPDMNTDKERAKRAVRETPRQFLPSVSLPSAGVDESRGANGRNGNETYGLGLGRTLRALPNEPQEPKQQLLGISTPKKEPRAAYLTVRDPNINIESSKQHIGPWYIADSGKDIGFNDLWYQNLDLDENGTSVMFQESGLYLIYAQVYYVTASRGNNEAPLGFRIYLNKEISNTSMFRRPIPIAECVPSFPSTFYQTCFTQICWYVEKGDSVYLEHFTKARPVISSEDMGQTFLGIVRLSQ